MKQKVFKPWVQTSIICITAAAAILGTGEPSILSWEAILAQLGCVLITLVGLYLLNRWGKR